MSPEDFVHDEDTHRYIAGLDQLSRLFGQPTDEERLPTHHIQTAQLTGKFMGEAS